MPHALFHTKQTMKYKLKILSLKCYLPDEADGDEVFLKSEGKKIWPVDAKYTMAKDEITPIGLEFIIQKGDVISYELWDHDKLSANDHLGSLTIHAEAHGHYANDFIKRGKDQSKYGLEWELG